MKFKKEKMEKILSPLPYYRIKKTFQGMTRGTVIIGKRVIWGFPHIKRIFRLDNGIEKNIGLPVFAEEKIDGFNARIASINGKIFGFSRGGFLDSFITEKAREMKFEKFFLKYPEYVICAEMIGNTPHTTPEENYDVKLLIFEIDQGDGSYIHPEKRYSIIKEFDLEGVPAFGKIETLEDLRNLALNLNKSKKEGMVLKNGKKTVKFVTANSDIEDIGHASKWIFDNEQGFFLQRILRPSFFIDDYSLDVNEYSIKLGNAFFNLIKSVREAKKGEMISSEFVIKVKDDAIFDEIKRHMSKDVKIELVSKKEIDGEKIIRFKKIFKKTSKLLISYSNGLGVTD